MSSSSTYSFRPRRRFSSVLLGGLLSVLVASSFACTGTIDEISGRQGEPGIEFLSPTTGATESRDQLGKFDERVARFDVKLEVSGLASVELWAGSVRLNTTEVDNTQIDIAAEVPVAGEIALEARGLDESGDVVISAETAITINEPTKSCAEWLDFYGVNYEVASAHPGIEEPISVSFPISKIAYRYNGSNDLRESLLGDCSLILALAESAPVLRRREVTTVVDIGVYNYRCIGGGTPPNCPNGISQHAYAKAIDIAGYETSDGTSYVVNDDWIIDGEDESTCGAATENTKDTFLHETICEQKQRGIWNIVLTPNFNSAHRDHFHVDLTDGSDFTNIQSAPVGH